MPEPLDPQIYRELVRQALVEDLGSGDITTDAIVGDSQRASGVFLAKRACVVAGLDVAREVFHQLDPRVTFLGVVYDGDACAADDLIARVNGPAASILIGERTALNFLQWLSGVATETHRFVEAAGGRVNVLDTRKTVPTLRAILKYAVRCGGGVNHRMGLYDGVLIKDNHIRLAGGIEEAIKRVRATGTRLRIEVETQSLADVDAAIAARADIIMLDNLDDDDLRDAIARIAGRAHVEISGGITLDRLHRIAPLGADDVSVGAITHSAPAADIALEIE
ncbi:MAG TPA: carboxylating nicotinate-nucleotide diphosphorylase [Vicinamibacterales bacterium]|nr:carboxylating nicotinate-nucleotide diphosphorylase [Vicinamibacterales bacterium]